MGSKERGRRSCTSLARVKRPSADFIDLGNGFSRLASDWLTTSRLPASLRTPSSVIRGDTHAPLIASRREAVIVSSLLQLLSNANLPPLLPVPIDLQRPRRSSSDPRPDRTLASRGHSAGPRPRLHTARLVLHSTASQNTSCYCLVCSWPRTHAGASLAVVSWGSTRQAAGQHRRIAVPRWLADFPIRGLHPGSCANVLHGSCQRFLRRVADRSSCLRFSFSRRPRLFLAY